MTDDWREGRRAWDRLAGQGGADEPLSSLHDVRLVRSLMRAKEREIVLTARQTARSWSEIGIALGVTRQAAWNRWHHLDTAEET